MIVWVISLFGWGASFLLWASKLYRLKREHVAIPRMMVVITAGMLVFTCISIALLVDPVGLTPVVRWIYALSSLGFLLAAIWKGRDQ